MTLAHRVLVLGAALAASLDAGSLEGGADDAFSTLELRRASTIQSASRLSSASICPKQVPMGAEDSIWTMQHSHPSCRGEFKSEGFGACAGDPTSISLDMRNVSNKQGCYVYSSRDKLTWSMRSLKQLDFDVEWEGCGGVWFAPLWLTPSKWVAPQGTSGEIDLIESCKSHAKDTVGTSIICGDHPDSNCFEPQWGSAVSSNGPIHMRAKIDEDGTWTMEKCTLGSTDCELISQYPRFLGTTTATKNQDLQFNFMTDLYNGGGGDDGWKYCGQLNVGTQCRYTIANIKLQERSPPWSPSQPPGIKCAESGWDVYDPTRGYLAVPATCCSGLKPVTVGGRMVCPTASLAQTVTEKLQE